MNTKESDAAFVERMVSDHTTTIGANGGDAKRLFALARRAARQSFQNRVDSWLIACFGETIARDKAERNQRFIEEALELVQANGCTKSEAHQLVDYVYGRPVGELAQEVGGVMNTLAALCLANGLDMDECGEIELARVWTKVEAIRAKQAAKPKHSPLPAAPIHTEKGETDGAAWTDAHDLAFVSVSQKVIDKYLDDYEFESDGGARSTTEEERILIEDFGEGLLSELQTALRTAIARRAQPAADQDAGHGWRVSADGLTRKRIAPDAADAGYGGHSVEMTMQYGTTSPDLDAAPLHVADREAMLETLREERYEQWSCAAAPLDLVERKTVMEAIERIDVLSSLRSAVAALPSHPAQADAIGHGNVLFENSVHAPFADSKLAQMRKSEYDPAILSLIDECLAARRLLNGPATLTNDATIWADAIAAVEARQAEWKAELDEHISDGGHKHGAVAHYLTTKQQAADEILAILKSTRGAA